MNPIEESIYQYINNIIEISEEQEPLLIQYCRMFSAVITGSFYVLDISKKRFIYIKPDDLLLCGYSVKEAMKLNFDLFPLIIHPEDLSLWNNFLEIIPQHLQALHEKRNEIDHISCTVRLIRKNSYTKDPLSQVLYQRMIPVWKNEKISYLICSVESVAYKKNGFYLHYKNSLTYEKYEPAVGSWSTHTMSLLNERERILLNLSRQGLNSNEISETLCRSKHTIQNQIKALFVKLNVHSIQEAIERANHCNANNMPILCQFISPRYRATAYGIMNMTGVFAGAAITDILGKSTDAGNLGHDFAMLAGLVLIALLIQVIFLRPKVANMTDEC